MYSASGSCVIKGKTTPAHQKRAGPSQNALSQYDFRQTHYEECTEVMLRPTEHFDEVITAGASIRLSLTVLVRRRGCSP